RGDGGRRAGERPPRGAVRAPDAPPLPRDAPGAVLLRGPQRRGPSDRTPEGAGPALPSRPVPKEEAGGDRAPPRGDRAAAPGPQPRPGRAVPAPRALRRGAARRADDA